MRKNFEKSQIKEETVKPLSWEEYSQRERLDEAIKRRVSESLSKT